MTGFLPGLVLLLSFLFLASPVEASGTPASPTANDNVATNLGVGESDTPGRIYLGAGGADDRFA